MTRTGSPAFRLEHQRHDYRGQSDRLTGRSAAGVLDTGDPIPVALVRLVGPSNADGSRNLINVASANLALDTRAPRVSSPPGRFRHGCSRRAAPRQPASTTPANSSAHWSAWSISTVSTPGLLRFSVGAVNVRTGKFRLLRHDDAHDPTGARDGKRCACRPVFPPVEIEGEHYWDGGLVSNTPLQWVVESEPRRDTLAFQVDLWSARGEFPRSMSDVITREKEIRYSSRTRAGTDQFKHIQKLRRAAAALLEQLPADLKNSPEAKLLGTAADRKVFNIVHLIYRARNYEGHSKDYEFSRASMEEHWRAGYHDVRRTLRHPKVLERPGDLEGLPYFRPREGQSRVTGGRHRSSRSLHPGPARLRSQKCGVIRAGLNHKLDRFLASTRRCGQTLIRGANVIFALAPSTGIARPPRHVHLVPALNCSIQRKKIQSFFANKCSSVT